MPLCFLSLDFTAFFIAVKFQRLKRDVSQIEKEISLFLREITSIGFYCYASREEILDTLFQIPFSKKMFTFLLVDLLKSLFLYTVVAILLSFFSTKESKLSLG